MGERRFLATTAVKLARAIAAQGQSAIRRSHPLDRDRPGSGGRRGPVRGGIGQGLSARILADRGRHPEAVELARSAAALTAQTDLLSERADILLDLAHVLAAAGRVP